MDFLNAHHAQLNAALFALQLFINFNQNAFSPSDKSPKPWTYNTLLQPAGVAFLIWLVIYLFMTAMVATDLFFPQHSLFTHAPNTRVLRLCFTVSCVVNMGWIILFNWLQWVHVAALDLTAMWLALVPIYLYSVRVSEQVSWIQFLCSHMAVRLYFSWVSAATMLNVSLSWQTLHGGYLSFGPYALMLALLLTVILSGVVYANDKVIGCVGLWALYWLTQRTAAELPDATQQVFVKVQVGALVGLLALVMVMVVAAIHRNVAAPQWATLASADVLKPLLSR